MIVATGGTSDVPARQPLTNRSSTQSHTPAVPRCRHDLRYTWVCLRADWSARTGPIGKLALLVQRFGHLLDSDHLPRSVSRGLWPLYRLVDAVWVKLLVGADLHHTCCI